MKYIPNLIPKESRVLIEYFSKYKNTSNQASSSFLMVNWIAGIIFIAASLILLPFIELSSLLFIIGLILIPPILHTIEIVLKFRITNRIKFGFISILILVSLPVSIHKISEERIKSAELKELAIIKEKEHAEFLLKEKLRIDSLAYHLQRADDLIEKNSFTQARNQLKVGSKFAITSYENDQVKDRYSLIYKKRATEYIKARKYKLALIEIDSVGLLDAEFYYYKAICLSKTGQIKEAVFVAQQAVSMGYFEARSLYEKLNPIKKRVKYYYTLCCDGSASPSNAKGRGACSHHGGVCNFYEPVYEEYRKY